jgi:propanol-preferring alcohol dehydrogenase
MDGGYAQYTVAYEEYCFNIPGIYSDAEAAPLLCAGLIGYRSYRKAGEGILNLGLYGFGAAAHIIVQLAVHEGKKVFAFTRKGDHKAQRLAKELGAFWAGASEESPPQKLDASIIFAPVGPLIPTALKETVPGGKVVCAGIYMSDIPKFPYSPLWEERSILSVANLTRKDGEGFFKAAPEVPVKTRVKLYPFAEANRALEDLRKGNIEGAAVLDCS